MTAEEDDVRAWSADLTELTRVLRQEAERQGRPLPSLERGARPEALLTELGDRVVEGDPYEPLDEGSLTEMTLSDAVDEAFEEALADPGTAAARAVDAGRAGAPDQSARGARSPEPDPAQLAITARPPSAAAAFEADEVEVEVELDRADEGCAASAESADDEAAFEVDAWVERDTPPPSITYELAADAELDEPFRGEAASAAPDEVLAEPEPPARITPEDTELEEVTDPLERFDAEPEPLHALHQGVPISGALPEGVEVPGPLEALPDRLAGPVHPQGPRVGQSLWPVGQLCPRWQGRQLGRRRQYHGIGQAHGIEHLHRPAQHCRKMHQNCRRLKVWDSHLGRQPVRVKLKQRVPIAGAL